MRCMRHVFYQRLSHSNSTMTADCLPCAHAASVFMWRRIFPPNRQVITPESGLAAPLFSPALILSVFVLFFGCPPSSVCVFHVGPSASVIKLALSAFLSFSIGFSSDCWRMRTETWCCIHAGKSLHKMCFHDKQVLRVSMYAVLCQCYI